MQSLADLKQAQAMLGARGLEESTYRAFHPLHKLRGHLYRMGRAKLRKNTNLLHLNPIEGVLLAFSSDRKFPYSPGKIIQL